MSIGAGLLILAATASSVSGIGAPPGGSADATPHRAHEFSAIPFPSIGRSEHLTVSVTQDWGIVRYFFRVLR